jgi:hypothetical protein
MSTIHCNTAVSCRILIPDKAGNQFEDWFIAVKLDSPDVVGRGSATIPLT